MNLNVENLHWMLNYAFASLLLIGGVFWREWRMEKNPEAPRYRTRLAAYVLPAFLTLLPLGLLAVVGFYETVRVVLGLLLSLGIQICLYYPLLMLLLPFLRKHIRAWTCAFLWLIPTYLYLFSSYKVASWVLVVPGKLIWVILGVWFAGFVGVIGWKILEHLRFRRWLLEDAAAVMDHERLTLWGKVMEECNMLNSDWKLMTSPKLTTPLTIGLFRKSIRVMLPERDYTMEELELVLHHELAHIGREDSWGKFFLVFCKALCWFNPLVWISMGRSAEDMERCCDELVLARADDAKRRQYARLVLKTAGDERGFTTCLSASAESMRYRLKSIMEPRKRFSGVLVAMIALTLLFVNSGHVALAYPRGTGAALLYGNQEPREYKIDSMRSVAGAFDRDCQVADAEAFHTYLAGLEFYELTGDYAKTGDLRYSFALHHGTGGFLVLLFDQGISLMGTGGIVGQQHYYLPDGLDWEYLDSLMIPEPAMDIHLSGAAGSKTISGYLFRIWTTQNGERLEERKGTKENAYSQSTADFRTYDTATFTFSEELAGPVTVLVEDSEGSYTATLTGDEPLPLVDHPAHYTVYAPYWERTGRLRKAEFHFHLSE